MAEHAELASWKCRYSCSEGAYATLVRHALAVGAFSRDHHQRQQQFIVATTFTYLVSVSSIWKFNHVRLESRNALVDGVFSIIEMIIVYE